MKKIILISILVGCVFSTRILAQIGTNDNSFNPTDIGIQTTSITGSAIQPDGKTILIGNFTYQMLGKNLAGIIRINANGTADDTFVPPAILGTINAIALQTDGKVVLAGNFTFADGTSVGRIIRLNATGSIDATFNTGTGFNAPVFALAVLTDGKILAGGAFESINGLTRTRIARLNADGSNDAVFDPGTGFNNDVLVLRVQTNNSILVGGRFTDFDGFVANRLARITANGFFDPNFALAGTGFNNAVNNIQLLANGNILVGGLFSTYNGIARNGITRLLGNGALDVNFMVGTGFNGPVNSVRLLSDGRILVGGKFTAYNGTERKNITILNAVGTINTNFIPQGDSFNFDVFHVNEQADGKFLIGGDFSKYNQLGYNRILRLNTDASPDPTFLFGTGFNSQVNKIIPFDENKYIVIGSFSNYFGVPQNGISLINTSGNIDPALNFGSGFSLTGTANILDIKKQNDGKLIVAGEFSGYNGSAASRLVRLNANATLDPTFQLPGTGFNASPSALAVQPDGKIIVGGSFTSFNATPANNIIRLNADGSRDASFSIGSGFGGLGPLGIQKIVVLEDGSIFIGGDFMTYNGTEAKNIVKLNPDGSIQNAFNIGSGFNNFVAAITPTSNNKLLIGGSFTSFNNIPANRILRLEANGAIDPTFVIDGEFSNTIFDIALQPDGKLIVGGAFSSGVSNSFNRLVRLNEDGSTDLTFDLNLGLSNTVSTIALQPDGNILVGGIFTSIAGNKGRNRIARVIGDAVVTSTGNKINQLISPQVFPNPASTSATFEYQLQSTQLVKVEVLDLVGRTIKTIINEQQNVGKYNLAIDAEDLPEGLYFIRIATSNQQNTLKWVVKK